MFSSCGEIFPLVTVTFDLWLFDHRAWPYQCQDEPACKISRSKVVLFQSYRPNINRQTHTRWQKADRLLCWTAKVVVSVTNTPWAIKRSQLSFVCNFVKYWRILISFSLLDLEKNCTCDVNLTHLTWLVLLHNLVKFETSKMHVNTNSAFNVTYKIAVKCTKLHWQFHKLFWWTT